MIYELICLRIINYYLELKKSYFYSLMLFLKLFFDISVINNYESSNKIIFNKMIVDFVCVFIMF